MFIKSHGGSGQPASPKAGDQSAMPEILTRLAAIEAALAFLASDSRLFAKEAARTKVESTVTDSGIESDSPHRSGGDEVVAAKSSYR